MRLALVYFFSFIFVSSCGYVVDRSDSGESKSDAHLLGSGTVLATIGGTVTNGTAVVNGCGFKPGKDITVKVNGKLVRKFYVSTTCFMSLNLTGIKNNDCIWLFQNPNPNAWGRVIGSSITDLKKAC